MKTVELKFVIDDYDERACRTQIEEFLNMCDGFPVYCWILRKANKAERIWRKKYDKETGR